MPIEVPSPIDLRQLADAVEWEHSAIIKRPWRNDVFAAFARELDAMAMPIHRVLELGSGPGFLAEHLLRGRVGVEYFLLDFSPAMHQLAATRLGDLGRSAHFLERNFKDPDWPSDLPQFDAIVTNQAVHELRHKEYAVQLHAQVRSLLAPQGAYLVCDHFAGEGGMRNEQLYASVQEQRQALLNAGFLSVVEILRKGGMVMHRAA
jgi:SAM-dependent methyltransferase